METGGILWGISCVHLTYRWGEGVYYDSSPHFSSERYVWSEQSFDTGCESWLLTNTPILPVSLALPRVGHMSCHSNEIYGSFFLSFPLAEAICIWSLDSRRNPRPYIVDSNSWSTHDSEDMTQTHSQLALMIAELYYNHCYTVFNAE